MARNIYMTDGSPEGFFTAVFDGWRDKDAFIASSRAVQTALGDEFIPVPPDAEKAARVVRKLRRIDNACLYEIDCVLRTPDAVQGTGCLFVYPPADGGKKARPRDAHPPGGAQGSGAFRPRGTGAAPPDRISALPGDGGRRVLRALRTRQRRPWNFSCPIFAARFKTFPFVIHDLSRGIAGLCNGREWKIVPAADAELVLSEEEEGFERLWKKYYAAVNIPSRRNVRQQKGLHARALLEISPRKPRRTAVKAAELSDFAPHNPFFRQNLPPFDFFHPLYSLASCQKEEYNR